jgi:hypothetical protein
MYLFIYSLFNNDFSVKNLCSVKAKDERRIKNGKGGGRKWWWPNLRYYLSIRLALLMKTMKNLSQDNPSPGRDFNPIPPEYKAGLLTIGP